jgi:hypothetical protein
MQADHRSSLIGDSVRAHALLFEKPLRPHYAGAAGIRVLVAFVAVALGAFYLLRAALDTAGVSGSPSARAQHPTWKRPPVAMLPRSWQDETWSERTRSHASETGDACGLRSRFHRSYTPPTPSQGAKTVP